MSKQYKPQRGDITQPMVLTIGLNWRHNKVSPVGATYHNTQMVIMLCRPYRANMFLPMNNLYPMAKAIGWVMSPLQGLFLRPKGLKINTLRRFYRAITIQI